MRIIGIEEYYQPPSMGNVRLEWARRTKRPDMMDLDIMKRNVFPRLSIKEKELIFHKNAELVFGI